MAIGVGIGVTDRGAWLDPRSVRFTKQLGSRGSCSCTMKVPDESWAPAVGEDFFLYDGVPRVFGGSIEEIAQRRLGTSGYVYDLTVSSNERKCDKRLIVPRAYLNKTAGYIVADILANELASEAITAGTVSAGATISKIIFDWTRVSDALDELAKLSNYIWYVDPDSLLYFIPRTFDTGTAATGADILWQGFSVRQSRVDLCTRRVIRVSPTAFTPITETFQGDDVTTVFNLSRPATAIEAMTVTGGARASVAGSFTGVPTAGDTIVINGVTYTWRAAIDNGLPNELLIPATAGECASTLFAAVNNTGTGSGTAYSYPTSRHPNCEITTPTGGNFSVRFALVGSIGNGIPVSESCANFTFAAVELSGGVDDAAATPVDFGVVGDTGKAWYWAQGETAITQDAAGTPLSATQSLDVVYRALGQDAMMVADDAVVSAIAAVEGTSGYYDAITDDTDNPDPVQAFAKANAILDAYKTIPVVIEGSTLRTDIQPGMLIPLSITKPPIVGTFLVEAVEGKYVPTMASFWYTVRMIDSTRVPSWLQFWESLSKKPQESSAVGSGSSTTVGQDSGLVTIGGAPVTY